MKNLRYRVRRYIVGSQKLFPGLMASLVSLGLWQLGVWQPLERLGYNKLFQIRNQGLPHPTWDRRVVVVAIDEASLKKYGRFPTWKRDRYTQLLQVLARSRPAVVGFDILFSEPSPDDAKFAQTMSSVSVVLAVGADEQGKTLPPVPSLQGVASLGHILYKPDADGIGREADLRNGNLPALSVAMLEVYNTRNQTIGDGSVVPIPKRSPVWINWLGDTQLAPTYSFLDVVEGKIPQSAFTDKLILVGVTATGLDPLLTPFNQSPPTAGVYFHGTVIDNLLDGRLLQPFPRRAIWLLLLIIGLGSGWLFSRLQPRGRMITIVLLPFGWTCLAVGLLSFRDICLPVAAPIGTILLAGVGVQLREQQEKQELMSLFARHVAPETAQLIWQHRDEILEEGELQAQEMMATVLFMDIRGFTTISENLPPRELLTWLNQYLDAMTDCIMDNGGVIDKYIGDAIMAVFGIPFAHTEAEAIQQDAINAIAACFAMHDRLKLLNQQLEQERKPQIQFGIGIHTGLVVAGSVGGSRRLNYSILGDTVNTAARLEAMNKEVKQGNPYNLLITAETYSYVRDRYYARPVKTLQLRGQEKETMICAILGKKTDNS